MATVPSIPGFPVSSVDYTNWNPTPGALDGDDVTFGSGLNDGLLGGGGNDVLIGGGGNDVLVGGTGDNWLLGGTGDDQTIGGDTSDLGLGGVGDDVLAGGAGADFLRGGAGNDILQGGTGDDQLFGGTGNDTLVGGAGSDTLFGGAGADTYKYTGEQPNGDDVILGFQAGLDKIDLIGSVGETDHNGTIEAGEFASIDAALTQVGNDAVLTLSDGGTITLVGVDEADITLANLDDYFVV